MARTSVRSLWGVYQDASGSILGNGSTRKIDISKFSSIRGYPVISPIEHLWKMKYGSDHCPNPVGGVPGCIRFDSGQCSDPKNPRTGVWSLCGAYQDAFGSNPGNGSLRRI